MSIYKKSILITKKRRKIVKLAQNRYHPQENNKDNVNKHKINIGNYLIKKNIYKEIMKLIDKN